MKSFKVGQNVVVKGKWSNDNFHGGEWGIIKFIESGCYHVALANASDVTMIFEADDLRAIKYLA